MPWFASWLSNPLMLGVGALAVLSPIIIHLLNKRRFKVVSWAAMDFLFDADKKNRRRVKLENFLLLLLRCVAMLLLGLLLARPFLPTGAFGDSRQFQRIILLDDSLSQRVKVGNQTAFGRSQDVVKQLLQKLAGDSASDLLTLYVTSDPEKPVGGLANEPVTRDTLDGLMARIDELQCSDQVARYVPALEEIQEFIEGDVSTNNQVVYILSDLRQRDWQDAGNRESETAAHRLVDNISQETPNTFVVDVGSTLEENLAVTEIRAEDLLVAGTIVRFRVSVTNFGETRAENMTLRFRVDDHQPQTEPIAEVAAGETVAVTFRYLFPDDPQELASPAFREQLLDNLVNSRVTAEIVPDGSLRDHLQQDSEAFFAAGTLKGIPVLIVDGDPSSVEERSESYYLQSLSLPGTGILVDTATVGELETISLTRYQVIFLCNVDEASPDRIEALRQWVLDGGGLVFMPGDRVRAATFNESFYRDGEGLSPLKLEAMEGDPGRGNWILMEIKDPDHPALRVTRDQEIGFDGVEIFSWWRAAVREDQLDTLVATPLLLGNEDKTPAMADRVLGNGRTVTFAFSADGDWTMWPADPTYVCVMWDLVNELAGGRAETSGYQVGNTIRQLVDLSQYQLRVSLSDPDEEKVEANARPIEGVKDSVIYEVEFPPVVKRGFYELEFRRENEEAVSRLLAVNVDPAESDLRRLDLAGLPDNYFGEATRVIDSEQLVLESESGANNEIWLQILLLLAAVLVGEQFLGWWFGRWR
jgi:hypothetical protein